MNHDGPYEIVHVRHGGPYGALCVVRRVDDPLGREVSMKVLRNTLLQQPTFLTRARDEARMLGRLNHPNIIGVEGLVQIGRRHVIVMEAANGVTLRQIMNADRTAPPNDIAFECIRQAARAMDHAYGGMASTGGRPLRIVHRDLRPGNLFITIHGVVKLIDFGVARADYGDRETSTVSTILGSEGYISPERFAGQEDTPAVDVYALGVTLLEMLSGALPTIGLLRESHEYIFSEHLRLLDERRAFGPHRAQVHGLIMKMCAYDPEKRPSMLEVQREIREVQGALSLSDDLIGYANRVVAPLFEAVISRPPREHPDWPEVAFLESATPAPMPVANTPSDQSDLRIRKFMTRPNWHDNYRDLRDLLAMEPHWTPEPFLPLLAAAARPWWQFWTPSAPVGQVVAALRLLRRRRTTEVLDYARALADHRNAHIAKAATKLLAVEAYETP